MRKTLNELQLGTYENIAVVNIITDFNTVLELGVEIALLNERMKLKILY